MSNQIMITKSNQASSKIFIYNSSNEADEDEKSEQQNFCDVTIHTSAPFEIRIKNNNYKAGDASHQQTVKSNGVGDLKEEGETAKQQRSFADESMAKQQQEDKFHVDEDVLMRSSDEKLYLGTIVEIAAGATTKSKYLVQFDDNSTAWALEQDLKKLDTSDSLKSDEPLCVACKQIDENDIVEVCNKCYRGYHRHCIKQNVANFSSPWCCERCSEIIDISDSEDNEAEESKAVLPYDLAALKWDTHHKENKEQLYCYCGKQGIWKIHMLQCCKCLQWFHERCIESWKNVYYLMHGDTFFVFCCKICNDGDEFIRRLDFNFKTTLHLVLYDFAMTRAQKSYSVSKEIAPFLIDNWSKLNIPFEKFISKEKLVKKILLTVKREDEFKMLGMSNKKKSDAVNLRRKCPPVSSIKLNLSNIDDVSDKTLKQLNIKAFHLKTEEELMVKVDDVKPNLAIVRKKEKLAKNFNRSNSEGSSHTEMIPDDSSDASSRSQLDWIIPIPSNFKGRNNPFHSRYEPNVKMSDKSIMKGQKLFEKPPEVRIVRTFKRRLSAKDLLAVGANQETKRRKTMKRRKTDDVEIISEIIQPVTMPIPTYFPVQRESNEFARSFNIVNSSTNLLNDGRNSSKSTIDTSKPKLDGTTTATSTGRYLGLFNGIETGEKITIIAKRTTFDGKTHYLLDRSEKSSD